VQQTKRYTREQLVKAVAASTNVRQVCLALGLRGRGGNYDTIKRHIEQEQLDVSHFSRVPGRDLAVQRRLFDQSVTVGRDPAQIALEDLEVAVAASFSIAGVARHLDVVRGGYVPYKPLRDLIEKHALNTDHFTGQGWLAGKHVRTTRLRPLEEVLVVASPYASAHLRSRLIREGLKEPRCEACRLRSWQGFPIPLELDHINGDRYDNRLENLRLLCPNCHALTDNYRGRNIGRNPARVAKLGSTRRT
jgi:hypothetical protein